MPTHLARISAHHAKHAGADRPGITGLFAPPSLSPADVTTATELMRSTGAVVRVESEAMIDAVTAVSGSGPAYVFHWIESMLAAAKGVGFNDADARTLVLATLKGCDGAGGGLRRIAGRTARTRDVKGGTTAAAWP